MRHFYLYTAILHFLATSLLAQQRIDNLYHILPTVEGKERVRTLKELGDYEKNRDAAKALELYLEAEKLAGQLGMFREQTVLNRFIGACYYNLNQVDNSLAFYNLSLNMGRELGDSTLVSPALYNIALLHIKNERYESALDYLFRSLAINQLLNDSINLGYDYNQLGVIYQNLNEIAKSDSMLAISADIREKQHQEGLGYTYINMAGNCFSRDNYDSAIFYYRAAKHLLCEHGDIYSSLDAERYEANMLWYKKEYAASKEIFYKVRDAYFEIGDMVGTVYAIVGLGVTENEMGRYAAANNHYQEALQLAEAHKLEKEVVATIYDKLYLNAKSTQDYKIAIQHLEKYFELYSSVEKDGLRKDLDYFEERNKMLQEKYDLLAQNQKKELAMQQHKLRLILSIGIIAILVIALVLLFANFKSRNASIRLLREKNSQIHAQQEKLEKAYEQVGQMNALLSSLVKERTAKLEEHAHRLQQQNERLENYAFINAHKVRGPLARILGLLGLWDKKMFHSQKEEQELLQKAYEEAKELDKIINELNKGLVNEVQNSPKYFQQDI